MAGRAARVRRPLRGVRPRLYAAAASRAELPVSVVQLRPVRRLRVFPGQRLYRARVAGAQGQPAGVLDQPRVPAVPDVRGGYRAGRHRLLEQVRHDQGRRAPPADVGHVVAAHAAEPAHRPQRAERYVDPLLRDGLLPAARGLVQLEDPRAQRQLRADLRGRRGRARRRAADGGAYPLGAALRPWPALAQRDRRRADHRRHRAGRHRQALAGAVGRGPRRAHRADPGQRQPGIAVPVVGVRDPGADVHRDA